MPCFCLPDLVLSKKIFPKQKHLSWLMTLLCCSRGWMQVVVQYVPIYSVIVIQEDMKMFASRSSRTSTTVNIDGRRWLWLGH
ncbi:hypothetical protein VIGAN_01486400 [Vigna angularis var. angularis]|uniref:Uncharacterized protein n=1 Tax=Vigna angularis var. angularis TaxID=157739 RepID=A0A0S3R893_PHAAN|nr:hypothetical protein VIGAN_01486400 [Vigna angularis var. angularis]